MRTKSKKTGPPSSPLDDLYAEWRATVGGRVVRELERARPDVWAWKITLQGPEP